MIGKLPDFFKDPHLLARLEDSRLSEEEPLLLALSGGADSASLLDLLCALRRVRGFKLYAAHVNHGIRGEAYGFEADRDEEFCRRICAERSVELFVHRVDVPSLAEERGQSLETAARSARYAFFAKVMREMGIKILVTAHNANDNLETQLFNLCRGCGIDGISGIPEHRAFFEAEGGEELCGVVVRPILSASKSAILELCVENGIEFVTDSTNAVDDCVRNKLRLNVIPQLNEIFTSPEASSARLAASAREDSDFIVSVARNFLAGQGGGIECTSLCSLHPSVAKRVIIITFEEQFSARLEQVHVEKLLDFARSGKRGSISLPWGARALFEDGYLRFLVEEGREKNFIQYRIPLEEGFTEIYGTDFAVSITKKGASFEKAPEGYALYASALLRDAISPLFAASRREGDRILDGGMHKRIKKLMCDKKVPLCDRDSLPLIFSGDELIYAPLCAVCDGVKAKKNNFDCKISVYKKI